MCFFLCLFCLLLFVAVNCHQIVEVFVGSDISKKCENVPDSLLESKVTSSYQVCNYLTITCIVN